MDEKDKITILLAEDNDGHAWLTKDLFKREGVANELLRFADGQEAWEYLSGAAAGPAGNYILLLDIRMPRMDGIELLRRIKGDPRLKDMAVLMVTSSDDPKEMEICSRLGCGKYFNKPLEFEKFAQALKSLGLVLNIIKKNNTGTAA